MTSNLGCMLLIYSLLHGSQLPNMVHKLLFSCVFVFTWCIFVFNKQINAFSLVIGFDKIFAPTVQCPLTNSAFADKLSTHPLGPGLWLGGNLQSGLGGFC